MRIIFFRLLLAGMMLSVGLSLIAMDAPEQLETEFKKLRIQSSDEPGPMDIDIVTLQASDGHEFQVSLQEAKQYETLKNLIEDAGTNDPIPLPNIDGKTLEKVVFILKHLAKLPQEQFERLRIFTLGRQEILNAADKTIQALSYLDAPLVKSLSTSDQQTILAPIRLAQHSPVLKKLINQGAPIAFTSIDSGTLRILFQLLGKLDSLLIRNARLTPIDQIYIPRAFQPETNRILQDLSAELISSLFNTADFLDLPFILNGIAAVIADRIHPAITWPEHVDIPWPQQLELVDQALSKNQFALSHEKKIYILKHALLRRFGVVQEYSVADYMRDRQIDRNIAYVDAQFMKLTSLFGIQFFQNLKSLNLGHNYLFDPSLDPQSPKSPFAGMPQLQNLQLFINHLIQIPADFLTGASHLQKLDLDNNNLMALPEELLVDTTELREFDAHTNHLSELPTQIFAHQADLRKLKISSNKIAYVQNGLFAYTKNLYELDFHGNHIHTIEPGTFSDLPTLREVKLFNNKIAQIQAGTFVDCPKLDKIYLHTNNIHHIEEGAFQRLAALEWVLLQANPLISLPPEAFQNTPKLIYIELRDTQLSPENLEKLRRAFPGIDLRMR